MVVVEALSKAVTSEPLACGSMLMSLPMLRRTKDSSKVSMTKRRKQLPEHGNRHESWTLCSTWQVHQCTDNKCRCFEIYHKLVYYCL